MIRDKIKSKDYFDKWISFDVDVTNRTQTRIDDGVVSLPDKKVFAASDIFRVSLSSAISRYSRGDDLKDLRSYLTDVLRHREQLKSFCNTLPIEMQSYRVQYERLSFDNYLDFFWWLSLAACLGMGEAHIQRVLALIGNAGQDALLDRIAVKLGDQRAVADSLKFPKQYALLLQALDAPSEEQPKLVKQFLEGWYKGNRNVAAWYDNHKGEDTGYVGYWCFEAALVVKLFRIDDASFRGHPHYPADLVHGI